MFRLHASSSYLINLTGPPLHQEIGKLPPLPSLPSQEMEQNNGAEVIERQRLNASQGIDRLFKIYQAIKDLNNYFLHITQCMDYLSGDSFIECQGCKPTHN
jgi:hypothetical protein